MVKRVQSNFGMPSRMASALPMQSNMPAQKRHSGTVHTASVQIGGAEYPA